MHSWFDGHLVYLKDDRIARDCVNQFLEIEFKVQHVTHVKFG